MSARFEVVSKYLDSPINLIPTYKTDGSAGCDFYVPRSIIIPSWERQVREGYVNTWLSGEPLNLAETKEAMKAHNARPTLVSTGVKCYLEPGTYLELSMRSSSPLNAGLVLANGIGVIDADYVDNPDNEGEIFLQVINLNPFDIILHTGDCIGQGIVKEYLKAENGRTTSKQRTGGFGSTNV